ncbi:DUF4231 domain-containing protein [Halomonas sp. LBP4]|uniref:DUF4231 domain-containing protein n=1 Tax=Halomonas sp. LBP4 TaxID=2044917 RepID=UPI000D873F5A|nr:DUF4231 domain-containing protein [Halomonas sp. LBP4]PXX96669.1 DUF4231 domain-containing protein [Halomonas sp. LBP4]
MIDQLRKEVDRLQKHHYKGQRLWSFAHHFSTFGAALLSLTVATLSQQDGWDAASFIVSRNTLIAILSLSAAILSALAARGGFERKWIANRLTRSKLDNLRLDMLEDVEDPTPLKEKLKRIISEHDSAIVGSSSQREDDGKG